MNQLAVSIDCIPPPLFQTCLQHQHISKLLFHLCCCSVRAGVDHFKHGRHVEAMNEYNKALDIDTSNVEALVARGALWVYSHASHLSYSLGMITSDYQSYVGIRLFGVVLLHVYTCLVYKPNCFCFDCHMGKVFSWLYLLGVVLGTVPDIYVVTDFRSILFYCTLLVLF